MKRYKRCALAIGSTILVAALLTIIDLGTHFGNTLAPLFVALVFAAYSGGLWAGLSSAAITAGYAVWVMWPPTPRTVVVVISAFLIALMVGWLKRRARQADTLNGNIESLRQALSITHFLLRDWQNLSKNAVESNLVQLEDILGNLVTRVLGWRQLRQEMTEVEQFYRKDRDE